MQMSRWVVRAAALLAIAASTSTLSAQGVTTGAISGTVTTEQAQPVEGAQVTVTNPSTGFSVSVTTSDAGRYHVAGLESGSNYRVSVRRLGYRPITRSDVSVSLGEVRRLDITMEQ